MSSTLPLVGLLEALQDPTKTADATTTVLSLFHRPGFSLSLCSVAADPQLSKPTRELALIILKQFFLALHQADSHIGLVDSEKQLLFQGLWDFLRSDFDADIRNFSCLALAMLFSPEPSFLIERLISAATECPQLIEPVSLCLELVIDCISTKEDLFQQTLVRFFPRLLLLYSQEQIPVVARRRAAAMIFQFADWLFVSRGAHSDPQLDSLASCFLETMLSPTISQRIFHDLEAIKVMQTFGYDPMALIVSLMALFNTLILRTTSQLVPDEFLMVVAEKIWAILEAHRDSFIHLFIHPIAEFPTEFCLAQLRPAKIFSKSDEFSANDFYTITIDVLSNLLSTCTKRTVDPPLLLTHLLEMLHVPLIPVILPYSQLNRQQMEAYSMDVTDFVQEEGLLFFSSVTPRSAAKELVIMFSTRAPSRFEAVIKILLDSSCAPGHSHGQLLLQEASIYLIQALGSQERRILKLDKRVSNQIVQLIGSNIRVDCEPLLLSRSLCCLTHFPKLLESNHFAELSEAAVAALTGSLTSPSHPLSQMLQISGSIALESILDYVVNRAAARKRRPLRAIIEPLMNKALASLIHLVEVVDEEALHSILETVLLIVRFAEESLGAIEASAICRSILNLWQSQPLDSFLLSTVIDIISALAECEQSSVPVIQLCGSVIYNILHSFNSQATDEQDTDLSNATSSALLLLRSLIDSTLDKQAVESFVESCTLPVLSCLFLGIQREGETAIVHNACRVIQVMLIRVPQLLKPSPDCAEYPFTSSQLAFESLLNSLLFLLRDAKANPELEIKAQEVGRLIVPLLLCNPPQLSSNIDRILVCCCQRLLSARLSCLQRQLLYSISMMVQMDTNRCFDGLWNLYDSSSQPYISSLLSFWIQNHSSLCSGYRAIENSTKGLAAILLHADPRIEMFSIISEEAGGSSSPRLAIIKLIIGELLILEEEHNDENEEGEEEEEDGEEEFLDDAEEEFLDDAEGDQEAAHQPIKMRTRRPEYTSDLFDDPDEEDEDLILGDPLSAEKLLMTLRMILKELNKFPWVGPLSNFFDEEEKRILFFPSSRS